MYMHLPVTIGVRCDQDVANMPAWVAHHGRIIICVNSTPIEHLIRIGHAVLSVSHLRA